MSNRITLRDLNNLLGRVRHTTGTPEFTWTRREDGSGSRCTVGAYLIHQGSAVNGVSWELQLSCNSAGGIRSIVRGRTAAELYDRIQSWLDGYEAAQRRGQ
jgi:hypothetical protein